MRNILNYLFLSLVIVLVACSESKSPNEDKQNQEYFPLSIGNYWEYSGDINFKIRVDSTSVFKNHLYYFLHNTKTKRNAAIKKDEDSYIAINLFEVFDVREETGEFEFIKLIEPGGMWYNEIQIGTTIYKHTFELVSYEKSLQIGNFQYNNLMQINISYHRRQIGSSDIELISESQYYYGKGIGIVKINSSKFGSVELVDKLVL